MYPKYAIPALCLMLTVFTAVAQQKAPSGLLCDLLAFPELQVENGYPVPPEFPHRGGAPLQEVRIGNRQPAFSWIIPVASQQSAYQIIVRSSDGKEVWNSGKTASRRSVAVDYAGTPLAGDAVYYWQVKFWDEKDQESDYATPQRFRMAKNITAYNTARYPLQKTDQQPVTIRQSDNTWRADFGKDAFGQLRLTLTSSTGKDTVIVRMGEALRPDGSIHPRPGGTIRFQEHRLPLLAGTHTYRVRIRPDARNTGGQAVLMPDYIGEVLPFRYVELSGYEGNPGKEGLVRSIVHYPFNDEAASFVSSDSTLNAVWELCKYSMKATTFAGVYVDGDRERIPYEADAYINQLGHYAADREFSLARYSHEYLLHHATWPTEWILQSVLMAWHDYLYTGDIRSARYHYTDLTAKLLLPLEDANGLISTRTRKQDAALLRSIHFKGDGIRDIVDWPHTGILGLGKAEGGETDGFVFERYNAVVNAWYFHALRAMSKMAEATGKSEDAKALSARAENVRKAYRKTFFDPKRKIFRDGDSTQHASLHANMFALAFGLADEADLPSLAAFIRSRGMACSVYGSQFLMDAVYDAGDEAYGLSLLASRSERSWYNMIRAGSTITMEAWDNKYKPNQDWNHAWGAVPANIIPRRLMGIEPLEPGFSVFRVKPMPGGLQHASLQLPTVRGNIKMAFRQEGGTFFLDLEIPGNSAAEVHIPKAFTGKNYKLRVNGVATKPSRNGAFTLRSGQYAIVAGK
ncbi:family 78 glycoside hydrolase catalytic domain [Chitinophaga pollutisoli]|uniref:alpha-L-rhamnosidase n=1 Tax=Chitinophaga pollutisoli TaxID=3133966 RepID=A0ABZ2YNI5_9BACT